MEERKKLVSIVIPAWNEEAVIPELGRRLGLMMDTLSGYDFEVIVVENGSVDKSYGLLHGLHENDPRFKCVQLSRNFTADGGVAAGLRYATGDCAVLMDADLQDPPEIILEFLEKWEEGYDVVYGIIRSREGVSAMRKVGNKAFYALLNKVTNIGGTSLPQNVTAFRLMDRRVYEVLNRMGETNRFTRGLCTWCGFKQTGIEFDRADRFAGETKAPLLDIVQEALDGIFSFSFIPLKLITIGGCVLSLFSFLFLAWQLVTTLFMGTPVEGYLTIICTILLMFGFLFLVLGIIGEYLGRIFDEVKRRPLYVVRDTIGFSNDFADRPSRRMPVHGDNS
ncbi:MAG: glycosyltransferase family 2 protein [Pseudomonadota bacterium]